MVSLVRVVGALVRLKARWLRLVLVASPGWLPATTPGPVSTAVGRSAVAAKAGPIGSECRTGGLANAKCGSTVRSTRVQAS